MPTRKNDKPTTSQDGQVERQVTGRKWQVGRCGVAGDRCGVIGRE